MSARAARTAPESLARLRRDPLSRSRRTDQVGAKHEVDAVELVDDAIESGPVAPGQRSHEHQVLKSRRGHVPLQ